MYSEKLVEVIIIILGILVLIIIILFGLDLTFQNLQEQKEQEQICNLKNDYYGFVVICYDDYFGEGNIGKEIDKHHYLSMEECEDSLESFLNDENCGVVEWKN